MAKPLLTDELWERIEPYLPTQRPNPKGGRPPIPNRQALTGILFVLKTGMPWEYLPQEMGCGSAMTCWRRLRDWEQAGVWDWPAPGPAHASPTPASPHWLHPKNPPFPVPRAPLSSDFVIPLPRYFVTF
jgi:hypothetical protein